MSKHSTFGLQPIATGLEAAVEALEEADQMQSKSLSSDSARSAQDTVERRVFDATGLELKFSFKGTSGELERELRGEPDLELVGDGEKDAKALRLKIPAASSSASFSCTHSGSAKDWKGRGVNTTSDGASKKSIVADFTTSEARMSKNVDCRWNDSSCRPADWHSSAPIAVSHKLKQLSPSDSVESSKTASTSDGNCHAHICIKKSSWQTVLTEAMLESIADTSHNTYKYTPPQRPFLP
mmetsp:Transcript_121726/g.191010  ORF Transcript_121726/g.191010 Transcript_121726/m.191010 type:complete len:239 (+) Transcript_121726:817-1533(+)